MQVEGLHYYPNAINSDFQSKILAEINGQEWSTALSRRTQHYGYIYDYTLREPKTKKLEVASKPPHIIGKIAKCLHSTGILRDFPNQIIVNEYVAGQGISKHRDHHPIFGYDIATISLGSGCSMIFRSRNNDESKELYLEKGSVLVFGGSARYDWTHEIPNRKSDLVDGERVPRDTRVSITFRHVNDKYV